MRCFISEIHGPHVGDPVYDDDVEIPESRLQEEAESWRERQAERERQKEAQKILDLLSACDEIRIKRLYDGFQYGDVHIRTDMVSIQNANGFMTFILAGVNVFPIKWRTRENTDIFFNNIEEYSPFVGAISAYVKSCYEEEWAAKDGVRNAATFDDAWAAFVQYRDK